MLKAEGLIFAEGFDQSDHEGHAAKKLYTVHGRTLRFSGVNPMNVVFAARGPLIVRLAKIGQCSLLNEVVLNRPALRPDDGDRLAVAEFIERPDMLADPRHRVRDVSPVTPVLLRKPNSETFRRSTRSPG